MITKAAWWAVVTILLAAVAFAAGQKEADDLPEGDGKKILQSACTSCHDLKEVTKFKGFYTRENWHEIVVTMVEYGAPLKSDQVPVLVDYLTKHLGKKTSETPQ
jgi:virginiamycin B lyase